MIRLAPLALLVLCAVPADAQEYDAQTHSGAMASAGQVVVMQDMRDHPDTPRRVAGRQSIGMSAVATCRNKAQAARRLARAHSKVALLYRLCARAGY